MAVGDIRELRIWCFAIDQLGMNVRAYRVSAEVPPVPTDLQVANGLAIIFGPTYQPALSSGAIFGGVGYRKVLPAPVGMETFSNTPQLVGTGGADLMPRQVCGVISLRTALAGRRFRGRAYIPFPSEQDNLALSVPNGAYVGLLAGIGTQLATTQTIAIGLGSVTLVPIIRSRRFSLQTDITTTIARTRWGTQRRRGSFGRPNVMPT